ncbi:MAG: ATP-dependent Clp protease ATP-binding subunit [Spirochaetota bacterium]
MMFEFTKKSRKILEISSQNEGRRLNSEALGPEHVLISLLKDDDSVAARILRNLGVNFEKILFVIEKNLRISSNTITLGKIPITQSFKKIIEISRDEARALKNSYIGTEHLLLAIFKEGSCIGLSVLEKSGIRYEIIRDEILRVLGVRPGVKAVPVKKDEKPTAVEEFTIDLTAQAAEGLLDPVIGRDVEISRVIRILSRKRKNNPILIGEAGVGKTAIVEGLAQRILQEEVPESLLKNRVLSLDLSAIVAGTKYRGEFEERLKRLVNEISGKKGIIIFIDEIHTLTGAGAAEGAIDAANILKPALARGDLQCIGATTIGEYKLYFEKDSALVRRFQNILIEEPDEEETLEIIRGLKSTYETFHKVKYSEEALKQAVFLSERYITDRYFPDKAIDVLDEAGAMARFDNIDKPVEIVNLEEEIARFNEGKIELVQNQEYEQAARVRDLIAEKKIMLEALEQDWINRSNSYEVNVEASVVSKVVAEITGIPLEELDDDEAERLLKMEDYLHMRIVGQNDAVEAVSRAIRRSRAGIGSEDRPNGVFIFLGPTGVGKTELARVLAGFLFDDERSIVRLDMSEFMEKHSVSRLIGSPPGYIGYEEGGQLTEKIKRKPYSIILLDEIEKAHPDIFNILLQVFDEGELTDSSGITVSFRDTVIIMTSNAGNNELDKKGNLGFVKTDSADFDRVKGQESLKKIFSVEFLNRIDEIVFFNRLSRKDLSSIVDIMLDDLEESLFIREIELNISAAVKKYLVDKGFNSTSGARNLKRLIQKEIEDPIAEKILGFKKDEKRIFNISLRNNKIVLQVPDKSRTKKNSKSKKETTLSTVQ